MATNSRKTATALRELAKHGYIARTAKTTNMKRISPVLHEQLRNCKTREEAQDVISFFNDMAEMWSNGTMWK